MHAAVAAGAYPDIHAAAAAMGKVRRDVYLPDEERAAAYDALYAHYRAPARPLRPRRRRRHARAARRLRAREGRASRSRLTRRSDARRCARGLRAARRAAPQRAGGVDQRQRLGARARRRT